MRVGLVCPYAWDTPGGVQQHVQGLAEALLGLGHNVSVLAPAAEPRNLPDFVVSAGRPLAVAYNGSVARVAFGPNTANRVRAWMRGGGFDLLHVHEPAAPSVSFLACWLADAPVVATFHTSTARSRAMAAAAPMLRATLRRVSGRIAVSPAAHSTLVTHLGGDARLIPNGVAAPRYAAGEPLPGWPGAGGALGFLGRMDEPRKGLPVLLKAFNILAERRPGLRLLLSGPGSGTAVERLVHPALRGRVVRTGTLSEDTKIRALRSVDVFCAPNLGGESFGIVLAEAMAAGVPVAASDIPAFRDVLSGGVAGALFAAGQPRALARAAGELLDDRDRRATLAGAAQQAAARFDWARVAEQVLRVYGDVCPDPLHRAAP